MVIESYFCKLTVLYETQQNGILKNTVTVCEASGGSVFHQSICQTAHCHYPQEHSINFKHCENLRSYKCVCVVHIVNDIFGFRIVTMVGLKCNSLSSRVFTCTCKLVHIVVPLLAACLGAMCCPQLSHSL